METFPEFDKFLLTPENNLSGFHALNKINNDILSSWWLFDEKIQVAKSVDDIDMHGHVLKIAVLRADGDVAWVAQNRRRDAYKYTRNKIIKNYKKI